MEQGLRCTGMVVRVTMMQWNERLQDKVFGYRTITEAAFARQCFDQGLSVNKTQRAIEDMRKGSN